MQQHDVADRHEETNDARPRMENNPNQCTLYKLNDYIRGTTRKQQCREQQRSKNNFQKIPPSHYPTTCHGL